jgi:hypothetical protein
VSVHNNDFESFICKKTSREGIKVSDGRKEQKIWTNWVCSIQCGLSVNAYLLVLKYSMYALACLDRFCRMSYRIFESLSRRNQISLTVSPEDK